MAFSPHTPNRHAISHPGSGSSGDLLNLTPHPAARQMLGGPRLLLERSIDMPTKEQIEAALVIAGKEAQKGVKEEGHNAGARVLEYLRSVGLGPGNPWCAAFINWSLKQAGVDIGPSSGATIRWRNWAKVTNRLTTPSKLKRGDLGGWTNPGKTTGHIFWIAEVKREGKVTKIRTVEGNTDAQGSREGDGVYSKWRTVRSDMWFISLV